MSKDIKMAAGILQWTGNTKEGTSKDITFCVTEDCNLACKYCYMTGKNSNKKISLKTAKKCVDYILSNRELYNEDSVVWNFIGGEPFLEIDLIDKISDYIKYKMFAMEHPWFASYRFNFSSNGILYSSEKVQNYIKKNKGHIAIGISIDGNKIKHDLQRVNKDGTGSYDDVMKNVELWLKQFPNAGTKATFASDDLIHLKDSIISLWENGIKTVSANVVFEDVWKEGDDLLFEQQLNELGDYILENKLWDEYNVRFFSPSIGNRLRKEETERSVCGSGKMLAIDCEGNFYPCIRFLDFSLSKRKGLCVGNVKEGMNDNKLIPFEKLNLKAINDEECSNCEIASGCMYCTGHNYDEYGTIFSRAKYICKMHKANVRANKRFWRKYSEITGEVSPRERYENIYDKKFLQILMRDDIESTCLYEVSKDNIKVEKMSKELFEKAIDFAIDNDYKIVLLGDKGHDFGMKNYYAKLISSKSNDIDDKSIVIFDNCDDSDNSKGDLCILLINEDNIENMVEYISNLSKSKSRINLILQNTSNWSKESIDKYDKELDKIIRFIKSINKDGKDTEINIVSDILKLQEHNRCDAGENTITLAPDGNFYICPAFYFDKIDKPIGNIQEGLNKEFLKSINMENNILCRECDAYQCKQCKYINKKYTGEYKVSPKNQCEISKLEVSKNKKIQHIV